eukprot:1175756-Prorocentrum_minimum.AAC.1
MCSRPVTHSFVREAGTPARYTSASRAVGAPIGPRLGYILLSLLRLVPASGISSCPSSDWSSAEHQAHGGCSERSARASGKERPKAVGNVRCPARFERLGLGRLGLGRRGTPAGFLKAPIGHL